MERLLADAERVAHFGCWEWQVSRDIVTWSDEMYRICGFEPGHVPVSFVKYLEWQHPDDRAFVEAKVLEAYRTKSSFCFEHRVVRPDGGVRTLMCYGDVELDEKGDVRRMFGTGQDITEQKRQQREREQFLQADASRMAAQHGEVRYRALVEASTKMVWRADRHGMLVEIPLWRQLTGQPEQEIRNDGWLNSIHPSDREPTRQMLREAQRQRRTGDGELRLRLADGAYRWFHVRAVPVLDERSTIVEWIGTFTDIHERKIADDTLALFGDASRGLLSSLDLQVTLDNLVRLLVPRVADFAHIDLVDDPGEELLRVASAHLDPAKAELLREFGRRYPPSEHPEYASSTAVRTGDARLLNDLDDVYYSSMAVDDLHLRMMRTLAPRAYIAIPLMARGRALGALVVAMSESGRRYGENDLALIEELGRRASLAVDNARLYAAERRARAVAESASRAKSDVLAVMSHELRTPLNAIVGYTNLIGDEVVGPINQVQRDQLGRVQACAAHLLELIEQVLTLSRLDAGRERVIRGPVDIGVLCRDAVGMIEPAARLKGLRLEVSVAPDVGERQTDETKLRQVVLNLLSNAVKFTEQGTVSLDARCDGSYTLISVRDTGIGIDAEHLDQVFERFWQVESHTRRAKGAGLGLSVSRDLARLLGGDIEVESAPGRGSTFTLRLAT